MENSKECHSLEETFTDIYRSNFWGSAESRSGEGSTMSYAGSLLENFTDIVREFNVNCMLDTSCGDWNWMKRLAERLPDYTGLDIVEELVVRNNFTYGNSHTRFVHTDSLSFLEDQANNSFDLILCRHTLEHLPTAYNIQYLKEATRVGKLLLVTTNKTCKANTDLAIGSVFRPINLELEPYDFMNQYFHSHVYDGPLNKPKVKEMYSLYLSLYLT